MWRIWQMTGNCRSKTVRIQRILRQKTMSEESWCSTAYYKSQEGNETPLLQSEAVRTAASLSATTNGYIGGILGG